MAPPAVLQLFEQFTHRFHRQPDGLWAPKGSAASDSVRLDEEDFDAIEEAAARCKREFGGHRPWTVGRDHSIRTAQMVGIADAGPVQLEILPKIDRSAGKAEQARVRLLEMVTFTERLPETVDDEAQLRILHQPFLETMIGVFADSVRTALLRGVAQAYRPEAADRAALRGRIDFSRQLLQNISRPDRIACRFPLFTVDQDLNRVLLDVAVRLRAVSRRLRNHQVLDEIRAMLEGVERRHCSASDCDRITLSRLTERFAPSLRLARLFLAALSPELRSGRGTGVTLLFDMNRLFEAYVARACQVFLADDVHTVPQAQLGHLLRWSSNGEDAGPGSLLHALKPDLLFRARPAHTPRVLIADTKYKWYSGPTDLDVGDVRQLLTYLMAWRQAHPEVPAHDALLVYPEHGEGGHAPQGGELLAGAGLSGLRLWVARVHLRTEGAPAEMRRDVAISLRQVLALAGLCSAAPATSEAEVAAGA